ncbi:DNA-directed RNA polymerase subunit beta [Candidatus Collierbacteria bacterium CG10_big_fil_rev_8_21_14_0_10_44_9]|uniref:DNA-directed RNA polymerase subunit beta n=1 Tax=Candidatus Collierbacteria bacterium CG10_big_fil_rev_8_21_14_0_10_44_9 TaxID=1974535 RepID=A0A2H0VIV7_9BACT|nr:MAG: DNA-directed RNA polymerase subunit beta [Candidatus Collierbacteria bacterium CG10_big_fil_rev_8_21_14_0_10_44_9]
MTKKKRLYWGNENLNLPPLDLTFVQRESYEKFLNSDLQKYLKEISPISDFTGKTWELSFGAHYFEEPKLTPDEAVKKGLTYDIPLRVKVKLINKITGDETEQDVFLGDLPKMTSRGTFIVSGIERAVVNQLVRAPGAFFSGSVDPTTGRVLYTAELRPMRGSWLELTVGKNDVITTKIDRHRKFYVTTLLRALGIEDEEEIKALFKDVDNNDDHQYIFATLVKDPNKTQSAALLDLYDKIRPGEPAVLENAKNLFFQSFFDPRRYDLDKVGRYKLNKKLGLDIENKPDNQVLQKADLIAIIKYLIGLQNGVGSVDDIDHLANRRVRRVGELLGATAFRIGLLRLERSIKEKMSLVKPEESVTPVQLINARPVIATISEFFRRNRLSTILDQTNPLAEIDNLRRLSVMGTGGVTRERASFSMRDINASQYGRICPVRSPEGPNIGLVTYLSLYTRINQFGFLESPYRKVLNNRVSKDITYLPPDDEQNFYITHAGIKMNKKGDIQDSWVPARYQGNFIEVPVEKVQYIDVIPRQVVGTSASLIPFIAHDEANRALMGTHMQCQAVPLISPQSPVVGTGMESAVAESMGWVVRATHPGTVISVDSNSIILEVDKSEIAKAEEFYSKSILEHALYDRGRITYSIIKFHRTAGSTCYNQKPVVKVGDKIKKDDLLIDGPASDGGELSLGRNLVIAYASFMGLGYEDAIIISDKLVKEDLLTSIHINEYEADIMDTKLGAEELTRDIPNVSENDLRNLGEDGMVFVGAEVTGNDILVGKIAPKGETELTAEERLLRAIFGEKAREVRDTSLRMSNGESGTVIEVSTLDREEGDELDPGILKTVTVKVAQIRKVTVGDKLAGRHGNKGVISRIIPTADMPYLADGTPIDIIISPLSVLARMNLGQLLEAHLGWAASKLGYKVALPVFEPLNESVIEEQLQKAGLPTNGKVILYDGRTGLPFDNETTVGIGYILKLIHMVEDKTHARSTGPYSLVTQQPLGGKAQMGGQRLGEMEVWALEAHRAAHVLQEMLTIKSDDLVGRAKAFEAIVKGNPIPESTVPESFKVLLKELNSLGLDVIPVDPKEVLVSDESIEELEKAKIILADDSDTSQASDDDLPVETKMDEIDLDELAEPSDQELKKTEEEA